jgi:hypothetical protein
MTHPGREPQQKWTFLPSPVFAAAKHAAREGALHVFSPSQNSRRDR